MTDEVKRMADNIRRGKELERQKQFNEWKVNQEMAQQTYEYMKEHYPYIELEPIDTDIEKLKADRLEYGYDSLCLRIDQLVTELAETKAALDHSRTLSAWKQHYGMRAVRIYDILDDLLDGKGHSDVKRV